LLNDYEDKVVTVNCSNVNTNCSNIFI